MHLTSNPTALAIESFVFNSDSIYITPNPGAWVGSNVQVNLYLDAVTSRQNDIQPLFG
jgi:hypothetical protein